MSQPGGCHPSLPHEDAISLHPIQQDVFHLCSMKEDVLGLRPTQEDVLVSMSKQNVLCFFVSTLSRTSRLPPIKKKKNPSLPNQEDVLCSIIPSRWSVSPFQSGGCPLSPLHQGKRPLSDYIQPGRMSSVPSHPGCSLVCTLTRRMSSVHPMKDNIICHCHT